VDQVASAVQAEVDLVQDPGRPELALAALAARVEGRAAGAMMTAEAAAFLGLERVGSSSERERSHLPTARRSHCRCGKTRSSLNPQ